MRPELAPAPNADPPDDLEDNIAPLEAVLASLRIWLIETLATLLELFPSPTGLFGPLSRAVSDELRLSLSVAEYDAKRALLCLALLRLGPIEAKPAPRRPPPGFKVRPWRQSDLRLLTHGVFNRRPLNVRLRIDRLRDMLDNPGRWIARLVKRLRRGFDGARAMLAAPPAERAAPRGFDVPAVADSS